jgi:hypothetical protein
MKKYWPLLLIIGILGAIIGMSQYADSAKHSYEESTKHTKGASVAKDNDGKAGNDAKETYQPPVWAKFVTWPEGVGAWAVILTLLAIVWQSVETRQAAEAAKAGADAALLNAKAFINSDRARFCVERLSDFNLEPPPEHGLLSGICVMVATYKNIGKSLCRVKEGRVRFHMVEKIEDLPPLPLYSKIDSTETTIPPNDTVTVWAPLEEHVLTAGTIMELRSHKRFLCFYARIDYIDAHDQDRVFQSCYVFNCPLGMVVQGINDKERFIVGGPSAYNTET